MKKRIRSRLLILAFVSMIAICAAPFCENAENRETAAQCTGAAEAAIEETRTGRNAAEAYGM